MKCLVDNTEHGNINEFNAHLRKLKITQEYYYLTYEPRKDLLTGESIPFKSYSDYIQSDFLTKDNLKNYCIKSPAKGLDWGINFLKRRIEEKKTIRAFHQVELRSLFCPTIRFFELYSDYVEICKDLGLETPFDYKVAPIFTPLPTRATIITDTREQKKIKLKKTKLKKLEYGDYALAGKFNKGVNIERKNISDFVGTLSKGFERFCREIDRAVVDGAYLIVLVEENIDVALSFNNDFRLRYSQAIPAHIFNKVRRILAKYDNIQFIFANGREESERVLIKLFELGEQVKNIDLQYYYELKKI